MAAAATTTALWLAGAFDREIVRITEVVEVREVVQGAAPQDTPAQPDLTTASTGPTASDDAEPSPSEEVTTPATGPETPPSVTTAPVFAPADLVAVVASRAIPSIVTVQNLDEAQDRAGSGSGVVISSDGFIITNHHVIEGADTLRVIMSDGLS
ncbi:MAG: hypothetical protein F4Y40_04240 [Acidimicrobiia bacterium]|nr:hypothetical protein [Acidimicrobiia bacterium]